MNYRDCWEGRKPVQVCLPSKYNYLGKWRWFQHRWNASEPL